MGRTMKRVPMDFNWPLNKVWEGYLQPPYSKKCPACQGSGLNEATQRINEEWYSFANRRYSRSEGSLPRFYNDNAHCYHLTQVEVDALLAGDRLRDLIKRLGRNPTVDEVNHWAVHDPMGHDAINRWICVEARAKELGVYGLCPSCGGKGEVFDSPEQEREYNSWTPREPPIGLGFQMWETTTEGSPQSPVFTTLMELAKWCAKNASVFANETASAEEWAEMLAKDNVHFREGNLTFV